MATAFSQYGPIETSSSVKLSTAVASNDATIDFTTAEWFDGTYQSLMVVGTNVAPSTDGVILHLRFSVASTWQTASYAWSTYYNYPTTNNGGGGSNSDSSITINTNLGSATDESTQVEFKIGNPSASKHTWVTGLTCGDHATVGTILRMFGGSLDSANAIDGIRLYYASGNVASGEITLYGLK